MVDFTRMRLVVSSFVQRLGRRLHNLHPRRQSSSRFLSSYDAVRALRWGMPPHNGRMPAHAEASLWAGRGAAEVASDWGGWYKRSGYSCADGMPLQGDGIVPRRTVQQQKMGEAIREAEATLHLLEQVVARPTSMTRTAPVSRADSRAVTRPASAPQSVTVANAPRGGGAF